MTATIAAETTFTVPPQVMSRLVGEETVLLDLASGMYFGLGGVGKRIWESVEDRKSCEEIAATIADEYDVELDQAQQDVIEFLESLVESGLLLTA